MEHWILTKDGIYNMELDKIETPFDNKLVHHGQYGQGQLSVIVDRGEIWSYSGGWSKLAETDYELKCLLWTSHGLLAGMEKAKIAWVSDNGLKFIKNIDTIENTDKWTTPWGGPAKIRSLALDGNQTIYADIHVGWIIRSTDGGVTWEPSTDMHKDVHQVSTKQSEKGVVSVATANGFYLSQDSGLTFERRWDGPSQRYCRAVEWYKDQDIVLISTSNGSSGSNAKLYRSVDRGETWDEVKGLPQNINKNINTYQLSLIPGGDGFVIIENSKLYETDDYGKSWELLHENLPKTYQIVSFPYSI